MQLKNTLSGLLLWSWLKSQGKLKNNIKINNFVLASDDFLSFALFCESRAVAITVRHNVTQARSQICRAYLIIINRGCDDSPVRTWYLLCGNYHLQLLYLGKGEEPATRKWVMQSLQKGLPNTFHFNMI